jgi:formiminotetrahydrofolate cyclodeaminase
MLKRNNDNPDAEELRTVQKQAETIRQELQQLAQDDVAVFNRLATAYKLPRTTEADAASRRTAIQRITRDAAEIPLQVAHAAARLVPLCTSLSHRSTRLLVSDVGVAATLARATVQSALLNVEINLSSLDDQNYVRGVQLQMQDLTVGLTEETQGVLEIALGRIRP